MPVFRTDGPARYRFRAVFDETRYANVSFFDHARQNILFHISLRPDDGLVALNHRRGQDWARESLYRHDFLPGGADVELVFANGDVAVWLDGHRLAWRRPRRWRFRDLTQITYVDHQGGLVGALTDRDSRLPEGRLDQTLTLNQQLEIRGVLDADDLALTLQVGPERLPLLAETQRDGRVRVMTALPGRVWQGAGDGLTLHVQLSDGTELARLRVTRSDILDRVRRILSVADLSGDSYLTALVAEHVRFADLAPRLTLPEQAALGRALHLHRLDGFVPSLPAVVVAPDKPEVDNALIRQALTRVQAAQRQGQDPLHLLPELALPRAEARRLLFILLENACIDGGVRGLVDWALVEGLGPFEPGPEDWQNSALLPVLFCQGRMDDVIEVLDSLGAAGSGTMMMPAIAWTVTEAIRAPNLCTADRDAILGRFARLLSAQAADYWSHSANVAMISATVDLLAARGRLPKDLSGWLEKAVLRCFGASRAFWRELEARNISLSPGLMAGQAAFAGLARALDADGSDDNRLRSAFSTLDRNACPDAPRLRRELLGPAGARVASGSCPGLERLLTAAPDPAEAALRLAAHPGTGDLSQGVADFCAQTMGRFYPSVPADPMQRQRMDALAAASTLIRDGGEPGQLVPALRDLTCPEAGFSGLAMALGLLSRLAGTRREAATLDVVMTLIARVARPETLGRHAAVHAGLQRLSLVPHLYHRVAPLVPDAPAPLTPVATALQSCPLHDTVVTVFSCRAHLQTRIPALRAGWLSDLDRFGVPYVVVVGDGADVLEGDVLYLDAPDDYEGLPRKTLAALEWVHDRTRFTHMIKVDDDCFLNVPAMFGDYAYRMADFHGRVLKRGPGQTDRGWHIEKATSQRGRSELDKSPEPSVYADGGTGYALSRRAMSAALRAARTPRGRYLRQVSFMEDKLLGDLLQLEGITPGSTGYLTTIRRRPGPGRPPVARWVNGFHASRAAPVKLVHLDTVADQGRAVAVQGQPVLDPKKIWPSYQPARLGYQSNALELVSPADRVAAARAAPVAVVACMRNEMFMLPHFLRHYRALGVGAFLVADNGSDDGTLEYLAEQPDVAAFSVDTDYRLSHYGVAWQQALMANFRVGKWSVVADADEMLVWQSPQRQTLPELLSQPDMAASEAVRVFMLDMYPAGPLAEAGFSGGDLFAEAGYVDRVPFLTDWPGRGPFSSGATWTSALRHRLAPGTRPDLFVAQKLAVLRYMPWMRLSDGLHYGADMRMAPRELLFGHFKYNADFHRKVRAEVARGQHFNGAEEYHLYLSRLRDGQDGVFQHGISVPWTQCRFVRDRLDPQGQAPPALVRPPGECETLIPTVRSA